MTTSLSRVLQNLDLLIAGGGPAGLAAAAEAARKGTSVLVVEREAEIGRPVHTSGGTAVKTMLDFGIPPYLYHITNRLRIVGPTQTASFEFDGKVGCVIDVMGVYKYLASVAQRAGACVVVGVKAEALMSEGRIVGARLTDGTDSWEQRAALVIDATGYRAALSKEAGLHGGFQRFGVGAEYEVIAPHYDQKELVIVVGSRFAPKGYAWAFPWGERRVRVGVGLLHADTRADPSTHLELLMEHFDAVGIDLRDAQIVEEHRGLIPSEGLPRSFVGDGILAVGDAAGQPTLVAGEGIRISLAAGTRAGAVAAAAVQSGDISRRALLPYEDWFRKKHGFALEMSHYINSRMASWEDPEWDEKIAMARGISGNDMAELLQSNFNVRSGLRWLVGHPQYWGRAVLYGVKAAKRVLGG